MQQALQTRTPERTYDTLFQKTTQSPIAAGKPTIDATIENQSEAALDIATRRGRRVQGTHQLLSTGVRFTLDYLEEAAFVRKSALASWSRYC